MPPAFMFVASDVDAGFIILAVVAFDETDHIIIVKRIY